MKWYLKALKNYADFLGRASKEEFWFFKLFNFIFGLIVPLLDILITNFLYAICSSSYNNLNDALWNNSDEKLWIVFFLYLFIGIYWLVTLIPLLAVTIRRLHDTGVSGWWILFLFIFIPVMGWALLLVLIVSDGTHGSNKYGENPKEEKIKNQDINEPNKLIS